MRGVNTTQRAKRVLLERLLEQGMVMVTVDARRDGVRVPPHLGQDPQLRLNLSHRFRLPMHIDGHGIRATLTFAGAPFDCTLPWPAVYVAFAHATGEPFVFRDDVPPEIAPSVPAGRERPTLAVVAQTDGDLANRPPSDPTRRAHLRVVK